MSIEELLRKASKYLPEQDVEVVARAYQFALDAHEGQTRDSGEAYVQHPMAVGEILIDLEMDGVTIAAALLHDVIEDTETDRSVVDELFGSEVGVLVDGVTKLTKLAFRTRREQQIENLRKMFLAMATDIRVILIKLADRLHNMRTLRHLPVERQRKIAEETIEIYAPLAHRLGIWRVKWELEDLCLRYLQPQE